MFLIAKEKKMGSIELLACYAGATHVKKVNNQIVESKWHDNEAFNGYFGVKTYFYNASNKDIKYVTFTYVPYNKVNDAVTDEFGISEVSKKVTGPIAADSLNGVIFDGLWKDSTVYSIKITKISVIFIDETTETIDFENITSVFSTQPRYFVARDKLSTKFYVSCFVPIIGENQYNFNTESILYKNHGKEIEEGIKEQDRFIKQCEIEKIEEEKKEKHKKQVSKIGCGIAIAIVIAIVAAFVWFASNL